MLARLKKITGFLFLFFAFLSPCLQAQKAQVNLGECPTAWPGVIVRLVSVERIPNDRLMFLVRIVATSGANPGTLIGYPPIIPPNISKKQIANGAFLPEPYSLNSATMTDEQTGKTYPALPTQSAPDGQAYRPSVLVSSLSPGQGTYMSVQFAIPPAPPANASGQPAKQTVSILLPMAKSPIPKIAVPTPTPAPAPK
jgi:hypothetical protein